MDTIPGGVIQAADTDWKWQGQPSLKRFQPQADLNKAISKSVRDGGYWEHATFEVPSDTSPERVKLLIEHRKRKIFGEWLESKGLTVLFMTPAVKDRRPLPIAPDRTRYIMFACVRRKPIQPIYDIPDELVPAMLKAGLRLLE